MSFFHRGGGGPGGGGGGGGGGYVGSHHPQPIKSFNGSIVYIPYNSSYCI